MSGGAIYLQCEETVTCDYFINSTNFVNNTGYDEGASIYYTYDSPVVDFAHVNFTDNQAPYGKDIAYPYRVTIYKNS